MSYSSLVFAFQKSHLDLCWHQMWDSRLSNRRVLLIIFCQVQTKSKKCIFLRNFILFLFCEEQCNWFKNYFIGFMLSSTANRVNFCCCGWAKCCERGFYIIIYPIVCDIPLITNKKEHRLIGNGTFDHQNSVPQCCFHTIFIWRVCSPYRCT